MASINPEALYNACVAGDASAVSRLLPAGGTPRNLSGPRFQFNNHKNTPLIAAGASGYTDIVRMMLERARNTNVDYANAHGVTAHLAAVQYRHVDILGLWLTKAPT
jgi:ankyrin repeat protein